VTLKGAAMMYSVTIDRLCMMSVVFNLTCSRWGCMPVCCVIMSRGVGMTLVVFVVHLYDRVVILGVPND